jgi:hypothetical protein
LIIHGNEKGTCILTNVAVLGVKNVFMKEAQKILKYKDPTIEIQRVWNIKIKTISVIT